MGVGVETTGQETALNLTKLEPKFEIQFEGKKTYNKQLFVN